MRKLFLLFVALCCFSLSNAQRLKLEKLELLLNASMDDAEEDLFLMGYSFLSETKSSDSSGLVYIFSNRMKTIGTAKLVWKAVSDQEPVNSFVKYVTYDRNEFEYFRNLMIRNEFVRQDPKSIDENSTFRKDNLQVRFQVTKDDYNNVTFMVILNNIKASSEAKAAKKINLKRFFRQPEER